MSKPHNIGARTFGIKLLEPVSLDVIKSPVTTRHCDLDLLKRTGEVKYIDEEGKTMPSPSAIENAKQMREEIITLDQFEAIGSYRDVAKRYMAHTSTAHAHLMHLRAKAEREEKEMIQGLSAEEVEQFHTDVEHQDFPKVEFGEPINLSSGEQNGVSDELKDQTACDCHKKGIIEACEAYYGDESELDAHVSELEKQWAEPSEDDLKGAAIGMCWEGIKDYLADIRRIEIERIDKKIKAKLQGMMEVMA